MGPESQGDDPHSNVTKLSLAFDGTEAKVNGALYIRG